MGLSQTSPTPISAQSFTPQQTVGPQPQPAGASAGGGSERPPGLPSLVDTKTIGKPPPFSGDVDPNGQPEGMPWSQWSFVFRSYLGAFDPTATRLLRQVESNVEDPMVVDNSSMTEGERRLSIQLVLHACFDLQKKGAAGGPTSSRRFRVRGLKPSWREREWTTQCRHSINGRAG